MGLYSGGHPRHHPLGNGGALLFARPIGASSFYADLLGYLSPPAEDQQGEMPFLSGEVRFNLNFKRLWSQDDHMEVGVGKGNQLNVAELIPLLMNPLVMTTAVVFAC